MCESLAEGLPLVLAPLRDDQPVVADQVAVKLDVWLCAHDELRRSRRMRLVWAHLAATLPPWLAQHADPGMAASG